jgi:hypothetical protein
MPCYQVNTVSVDFKAKSIPMLEAALKALKWDYKFQNDEMLFTRGMTINLKADRATIDRYDQTLLNQLKVAYSTQVVMSQADKRRWVIKRKARQQYEARRY